MSDFGRLLSLLLITDRKGAGDVGRQKHDDKGHRIACFVGGQRKARLCEQVIKNKNTGDGRYKTIDPMRCGNGCQQNTKNVDHDNIRPGKADLVEQHYGCF